MRRCAVLLLALLPACTGDRIDDENPVDDDPVDDPLPECDGGVRLSGTLDVPAGVAVPADAVLGLIEMEFGDTPALDTAYEVALVEDLVAGESAAWAMCLMVPGDAWHAPVEDGAALEIAPFVVGVWDDADGDGNPSEGEALVGYDGRLVVHARGEAPQDLLDVGGDLGWNVLSLGADGIEAAVHVTEAHDEHAVAANLAPHAPGDLEGVLVPDFDGTEVAVGLYAMWEMFDHDKPAEPTLSVLDGVTAEGDVAWIMKGLSDAPPSDHLNPMNPDLPVADWAFYVGGAWVDLDGDGQMDFEEGEPVVAASIVAEDAFVMAAYVRPRTFMMGMWTEQLGVRPGWGLYLLDDNGDTGLQPLAWEEGMELLEFHPN